MVLNWADFAPQRTFGNVRRHFGCPNWEENIGICRTRDVAKYLTRHSSLTTKNFLAPSISSAMVEKPCPWIFRTAVTWGHLKQAFQCGVGSGSASPGEPEAARNLWFDELFQERQCGVVEGAQTWV